MTNQEAIEAIKLARSQVEWDYPMDYAAAFDKAIEALEQEPTTNNDLGVDCISRADVLKLMQDNWHNHNGDWAMQESMDDIRALPSVTPQEPQSFKWCDTCKEYDQEKHCCHRWSKVIRDTVEEMKQEPKTGHCRDCKWWKDSDGEYRRGVSAESQCPINRREVFDGNGYCFLFEPQESEDKE